MFALLLVASALAFPGRPTGMAGSMATPEGRIRCHWDRVEDEALCAEVLVWAGEAWDAQVIRIGFQIPLSDNGEGGDDAVDIYLTTAAGGPWSAWVDCDGGDPNCIDSDPKDGRSGAPSYIVIDPRTPLEDFPHFVHHEFNHVLHYASDYAEPYLCLWEGTAAAAERWTDPEWSTIPEDLADYQQYPWASAILQDGYFLADYVPDNDSWYEYGAVAWIWWMDDRYGDGQGAFGPMLWNATPQEGGGDEPDILDAWNDWSGDWWQDMLDFALERAQMGTSEGPEYTAFAGDLAYAAREEYPGGGEPMIPRNPPFPLGTTYWDVPVIGWCPGHARSYWLSLEGDPSVEWGLVVVGPNVAQTVLGDFLEFESYEDDTVTIGVVNLGPAGMDADDPLETASFTLSLNTETPDVPCDTFDTGDDDTADGSSSPKLKGGCGCGSTNAVGLGALFLGLCGIALRRRHLD